MLFWVLCAEDNIGGGRGAAGCCKSSLGGWWLPLLLYVWCGVMFDCCADAHPRYPSLGI